MPAKKYATKAEAQAARQTKARAARLADPERFRTYHRTHYQKNREQCVAKLRVYRAKDPAKWTAYGREKNLRRLYGMSLEQYRALWEEQGRRCRLCAEPLPQHAKSTHVDHVHGSEPVVVRGILCRDCNHRLGVMEKRGPIGLRADRDYLGWK